MTERIKYRCNNCGHRFEAETLTVEEKRRANEDNRDTYPIACPECLRANVRRGWD
jgi:DNA-directed RNA polymerase subunit RPC12/RpoP